MANISIHALVKRATGTDTLAKTGNVISIHALVKRATRFIVYIIPPFCISIHALVKRATSVKHHLPIPCNYFNPRPREEGDAATKSFGNFHSYFNPRPREEGDTLNIIGDILPYISIHALVKRATVINMSKYKYIEISIHALVKRAT